MLISYTVAPSGVWATFIFPFRIGIINKDHLRNFWRPVGSNSLSGGLTEEIDPMGSIEKLQRFGEEITRTGIPLERIDPCHEAGDTLEIKIKNQGSTEENRMLWEIIVRTLKWNFYCDVQER